MVWPDPSLPVSGFSALSVLAWGLTYLAHSTLLLAAVWAFTRWRRAAPALQDVLWKTALVGAFLTATFQTAAWSPAPGRVDLARWVPASGPAVSAPAGDGLIRFASNTNFGPAVAATAPDLSWQEAAAQSVPWVLALWVVGAGWGLVRLARARRRLGWVLADRRPVEDPTVLALLERLRLRANVRFPVRLSRSHRIGSPIALGRGEIVLPDRALDELALGPLEGALAHELAHLVRRDPLWRWLAAITEATFFIQPMNRLARRRLHESAEFLCDDWAVHRTGQSLVLARCLVEVASWLRTRPAPREASAMSGSPLSRRVDRLLGDRGALGEGRAGLRAATVVALLVTAGWFAPGVTVHVPGPARSLHFDSVPFTTASTIPTRMGGPLAESHELWMPAAPRRPSAGPGPVPPEAPAVRAWDREPPLRFVPAPRPARRAAGDHPMQGEVPEPRRPNIFIAPGFSFTGNPSGRVWQVALADEQLEKLQRFVPLHLDDGVIGVVDLESGSVEIEPEVRKALEQLSIQLRSLEGQLRIEVQGGEAARERTQRVLRRNVERLRERGLRKQRVETRPTDSTI